MNTPDHARPHGDVATVAGGSDVAAPENRSEVDRAIDAVERARLDTGGLAGLPRRLDDLALLLYDRYQQQGAAGDLERAIAAWEEARSRLAPDVAHVPDVLNNL